jgi:hypothetical protein
VFELGNRRWQAVLQLQWALVLLKHPQKRDVSELYRRKGNSRDIYMRVSFMKEVLSLSLSVSLYLSLFPLFLSRSLSLSLSLPPSLSLSLSLSLLQLSKREVIQLRKRLLKRAGPLTSTKG